MNPLLVAASRCNLHAVQLLIECDADTNVVDCRGHTSLYYACKKKMVYSRDRKKENDLLPMVQLLLNYGAQVDFRGCSTCCHNISKCYVIAPMIFIHVYEP